jgi:hypothetical protein
MRFLVMGQDYLGQSHFVASTATAFEAKELRDEQEGYASVVIHGPNGLMSDDAIAEQIRSERNTRH